uniref:Uncharacterized protein n=1 Tax=Anopheles coluzzii TaxID=1518534 RepID=A0A8W7PHG9_ANOCL
MRSSISKKCRADTSSYGFSTPLASSCCFRCITYWLRRCSAGLSTRLAPRPRPCSRAKNSSRCRQNSSYAGRAIRAPEGRIIGRHDQRKVGRKQYAGWVIPMVGYQPEHLIRDGIDFDANVALPNLFQQQRMLEQRVAMPDTFRAEHDGIELGK